MNSKRLHMILLAVIGLFLIGLVAGAYEVNSLVSSESNKLAELKAKDKALAQQQTGLKIAKKELAEYAELEKISHSIVPEDKNQAETIRQLSNIASNNGIRLASITFPASTLGTAAPTAGISGGSSAPTPTPTVPSASTKTSQLTPVKTIPGVYELPITVTSDPQHTAPYARLISFLSDLENNRRTAQVTNISIQPDLAAPGNVSFIITLNEYIKP